MLWAPIRLADSLQHTTVVNKRGSNNVKGLMYLTIPDSAYRLAMSFFRITTIVIVFFIVPYFGQHRSVTRRRGRASTSVYGHLIPFLQWARLQTGFY